LSFNDYLPNGRSDGRSSPPAAKKFAFLSAQWREVKAGSRKILQNRSMRGHFLNIRKNGSGYSKLVLQALACQHFAVGTPYYGQNAGKREARAARHQARQRHVRPPISTSGVAGSAIGPPIEFTTTQVMR
jgi:hypothetical protein